ncbi:MAG: ABC transporter substrate-binding protein [Bacteroidota bacterium]
MIHRNRAFLLGIALLAACSGGREVVEDNRKVFRYNMAEGQTSLDPAFANNQANVWATTQMYNGLVDLDGALEPIPSLAEVWDISEDGLTYTFDLRPGVYFHDHEVFPDGKGREVISEDVVYSLKRIVDPTTASSGAWVFASKIKRDDTGQIAEDWVKAISTYRVEISLEQPFSGFLYRLAMPYGFIVPKEAVQKYGKDFRAHPVGTGPFKFQTWEEGNRLILLKNENYFRRNQYGKRLPYIDAVQVSFIADKNSELLYFQQGELDFLSFSGQPNLVDKILQKDGTVRLEFVGKYVVQKVHYMNTEYLGFVLDPEAYEDPDHPIMNKKFRQAMNYAINRREMLSYLLSNLGRPGEQGFVPRAIPSFNPQEVEGYTYDPEKAAELLAEAGYPEGQGVPEITLYSGAQSKDLLEYLQKQWEAIGIRVNIQINPVPTHKEMTENIRAPFFRGSWLADYPDAENYFACFYSKNFSPSGPNKTHFSNPEFDALFEAALLETDQVKKWGLFHEMDNLLLEEAPFIILYYDEALRVIQPNVTGLAPNAMNIPKLESASFMDVQAVQ